MCVCESVYVCVCVRARVCVCSVVIPTELPGPHVINICAVFIEHIARTELAAAGIVSSLCNYGGGEW